MSANDDLPAEFRLMTGISPFLDHAGPFYVRPEAGRYVIGLRIEDRHVNAWGAAHGGLLATMADFSLGFNLSRACDPPVYVATVNLTTDFASSARVGDWVEARVDIQKIGSRLAFANAYLTVGTLRILRASGVFSLGKLRNV